MHHHEISDQNGAARHRSAYEKLSDGSDEQHQAGAEEKREAEEAQESVEEVGSSCPLLLDVEFVLCVDDTPSHRRPLPIFHFSATAFHEGVMLFPNWSFHHGGPALPGVFPQGLGRWDVQMPLLLAANAANPWSSRADRAFFRGTRTNAQRDALVRRAKRVPDVLDAAFVLAARVPTNDTDLWPST